MALVVQMIVRISRSKARNGTNSAQAFSHSRMIAGYLLLPGVGELGEPLQRGGLGRGGVDGLEVFGDGVPVAAAGVAEAVAQQMHDAGLDDRLRPDRADRVGQALQPVADDHAHVGDAAVLDLGQHRQPVLGAFAARAPAHSPRMSRSPSTVTAIAT